MAKKTKTETRPAYLARLEVSLQYGDGTALLPHHAKPIHSSSQAYIEAGYLIGAVRELRESLRPAEAGTTYNSQSLTNTIVLCSHVILLESFRLQSCKTYAVRSPVILEFAGFAGNSFLEIAVQIGKEYADCLMSVRPILVEFVDRDGGGKEVVDTRAAIQRVPGEEWQYFQKLAICAASERLRLAEYTLNDKNDYAKLIAMLKAEFERVKPPKLKRDDTPSPTDIENVRTVMRGMGRRNPAVDKIRDAVRAAGYKMSATKIGRAVKIIREK